MIGATAVVVIGTVWYTYVSLKQPKRRPRKPRQEDGMCVLYGRLVEVGKWRLLDDLICGIYVVFLVNVFVYFGLFC